MIICVTGSVLNQNKKSLSKYNLIKQTLIDKCDKLYTPLETMSFMGSNRERFLRAQKSITDADIIFADVSLPSTGQGMELMLAKQLRKKVVCIAESGSKVSGLILGAFKEVFYYSSQKELKTFLIETISQI